MAHIDIKTLKELEKTGNGTAFVKQVIDVFIKDTPSFLQNIDKGFKSKQAEALRSAVHKYKSSSRSVGALALSQLCLDVEKLAKANQHNSAASAQKIEEIKALTPQVLNELKTLKNNM